MQSHVAVVTGGTVLSNCTPLYLLLCIIGGLFVSRLYLAPLLAVCAFTCEHACAPNAAVCAVAFWHPCILKLQECIKLTDNCALYRHYLTKLSAGSAVVFRSQSNSKTALSVGENDVLSLLFHFRYL